MNNVRDFGAVGDGTTLDTAAIQRAIDAGGVVNFPPGTYLTGTLYLKSYGGLHLENGATLLASSNPADYNADDFCEQNRPRYHEEASGAHLIVGVEVTRVVISGDGIIDGSRKAFQHTPLPSGKYEVDKWRPAQMIYFVESDHISIKDVELNNAPYWSCFLHGCEDVTIRGVKIFTEWRTRNGDGIDIDCCRRVTISDCIIDTGDDCITLRADLQQLKNQDRPCEDITVSNCILKTCCNAIRVGVGSGIIRKAVLGNLVIRETRTGICVVSKYGSYAGVDIHDIKFHDIYMECKRPFLVQSSIRGPLDAEDQSLHDVEFINISGTANRGSLVQGNPGYPIKRISFNNVNLTYFGGEDAAEAEYHTEWRNPCPPEGFHLENTSEVSFKEVRLDFSQASQGFRRSIRSLKSTGIKLENVQSDLPATEE